MKLNDFKLERYFARHEFSAPYLLCCSDCESFTVQEILDLEGGSAYEQFHQQWLGYTESTGSPQLRQRIASLYRNSRAGDVLVTSGAEEAIFIFMNVVLNQGDHVVVQYPCYQSLFEIAGAKGCEVTRWTMKEEDGWALELDFLEKSLKDNTRAIIINSPHNPTGYQMSRKMLASIVELAASRGIILFSDEVYRFLEYDPSDRLEAACDLYDNAVSLGVMSKAFGLAGLRIGWIATANQTIYNRMAAFKDYTSICNSAPGEFLATLALKHREAVTGRNLELIKKNLAVLDRFLAVYPDLFSWPRPKAGPIAFPGIRWGGGVDDFCRDLVNTKGVLLLPGSCYAFGDRHFRLGFGRKNMPECIEKLEEYVREKLS